MIGKKLAANHRAIRCPHDDAAKARGACRFDGRQGAHRVENSRGFRAQILGTGLWAGKASPVDENDVDAPRRERDRRRRSRGSAANDENGAPSHAAQNTRTLSMNGTIVTHGMMAPLTVAMRLTARLVL